MSFALMDVLQRLSALQTLQSRQPSPRLFALVDGAAYQMQRERALRSAAGVQSLFKGTPDAALARTGPWLVDAEAAGPGLTQHLALLEPRAPALCWCLAATDLRGLVPLMQANLHARLPDGRQALLRIHDPRVLGGLLRILSAEQRQAFCGPVLEWHVWLDGERQIIEGARHAQAQ